jgi:hypothetical protein
VSLFSGLRSGLRSGLQSGLNPGLTANFLAMGVGQSNMPGFTDYARAGTATVEHSGTGQSAGDPALGLGVAFPACGFLQHWQAAGSNPLNMIVVGPKSLQNYAAAGQVDNTGLANGLGRALVRYGLYTAPAIGICGVGSTSLNSQWAKSSGYPGSGETLYNHMIAFGRALMNAYGRPIDLLIDYLSETDSQAIGAATAQADRTTWWANIRADLGLPSLKILTIIINSEWDSTPFTTATYQTAQIAAAAADGNATTIDPSCYPLDHYPHYLAADYAALGEMIAIQLRDQLQPGKSINLGSGPAPWFQGSHGAFSANSGTGGNLCTARPRGYVHPEVGDIEILVAQSSPSTGTNVTLTTAAGFAALIAQTRSINGGAERSITVWSRTIDQTMLDARTAGADGVKRGPVATPVIDNNLNTLNNAFIFCVRGSSGITVTPVTGTAASGTTVTIPTITTTSNNSLVMLIGLCNQALGSPGTRFVNANIQGITVQRDGQQNPGAGVINYAMATGTVAVAGALGSTVCTFGNGAINSVNVGAAIVFNP